MGNSQTYFEVPDNFQNTKVTTFSRVSKAIKASADASKSLNEILKELETTLLTTDQICAALNITEPTLIKRRNLGKIPCIKLGRMYYYLNPEVLQCSK